MHEEVEVALGELWGRAGEPKLAKPGDEAGIEVGPGTAGDVGGRKTWGCGACCCTFGCGGEGSRL